jgi:hypothetical protein
VFAVHNINFTGRVLAAVASIVVRDCLPDGGMCPVPLIDEGPERCWSIPQDHALGTTCGSDGARDDATRRLGCCKSKVSCSVRKCTDFICDDSNCLTGREFCRLDWQSRAQAAARIRAGLPRRHSGAAKAAAGANAAEAPASLQSAAYAIGGSGTSPGKGRAKPPGPRGGPIPRVGQGDDVACTGKRAIRFAFDRPPGTRRVEEAERGGSRDAPNSQPRSKRTPRPIDPDWLTLRIADAAAGAMPSWSHVVRYLTSLLPFRDRYGFHGLAWGGHRLECSGGGSCSLSSGGGCSHLAGALGVEAERIEDGLGRSIIFVHRCEE